MINHRSISTLYKSERGKNEWTARMEEKSLLMFLSSPSFCLSEKCYNFFFPFRCHRFNRNWMEKNVLCWIQVGGGGGAVRSTTSRDVALSVGLCWLRRMSAKVEVREKRLNLAQFWVRNGGEAWRNLRMSWKLDEVDLIRRWCDSY